VPKPLCRTRTGRMKVSCEDCRSVIPLYPLRALDAVAGAGFATDSIFHGTEMEDRDEVRTLLAVLQMRVRGVLFTHWQCKTITAWVLSSICLRVQSMSEAAAPPDHIKAVRSSE